jgi:hypothetical protein
MPAEDDIVQRIVLEGDKAAIAQFQAVGQAGETAFARVNASAAATGKAFGATGGAFAQLLANLRQTGHDSEEAAKGMDVATQKGTSLATTLRLLGRGTHTRELSQLGRVLGVLGRAFTVAAPALLAVGLEKTAAFGAEAADKFATLADETKVTTDQMTELQAAGTGVGLSLDDSAKSFKAVNDSAKQAAENVAKNEVEFRQLSGAILDARNAGDRMVEGFHKIDVEGANALTEFQKATRKLGEDAISSAENLATGLRNIQEQRDAINGKSLSKDQQRARQLRDLDEQEKKLKDDAFKADRDRAEQQRKLDKDFTEGQEKRRLELIHLNQEIEKNARAQKEAEDALKRAQIEAQKNATTFEKLGIATVDANNKLKDTPTLLSALADALHNVSDPLKQKELEFSLVKDGIDRKLIPALRRGADGFKALEEANKKIIPGFTPEQIKIADDFAIATQQASSALRALFEQMGIAIAPAFIPVFEKFREILVEIRPGMVAFAGTLSKVVGPILSSVATIIKDVIVPAFSGLIDLFDLGAKLINSVFGTNIKGVELFTAAIVALAIAFGGIPVAVASVVVAFGIMKQFIGENKLLIVSLGVVAAGLAIAFGSIPIAITAVVVAVGLLADFLASFNWKLFTDGAAAAWNFVKQGATDAANWVIGKFTALSDFLSSIWSTISTGAQNLWIFISDQALIGVNFVTGIFSSLRDSVIAIWDAIKNKIVSVWNQVKDIVAAVTPSGAGGGGAAGFAGGGHIRGPGGPKSDKIPIWASNGEFMQPFAAVRKYGLGFMEAIRTLRFDPAGFDVGGLVGFNAPNPQMKFAQGGLISGGGGGTLNLTIDGTSFDGLRAGADTMDKLTRYATSKQIKSAGRKASWVK